MRIGELIAGLDVRVRIRSQALADHHAPSDGSELDVRICDLTEDSRTALPGSLFIARAGSKADGKTFVASAVAAGAVAVLTDDPGLVMPTDRAGSPVIVLLTTDINLATAALAERFFGQPSDTLTLLGVTGTNGKTTTTYLMHQMLNLLGIRAGLIGTVLIDDGVETAPATMTTPPALEVSRTLARMVEAGCTAAVMEVSSHALDQHRVGALRFAAGVFTNLTGDHLDYHKSMDNYAHAKAKLFAMLPARAPAVVNVHSPWHQQMLTGSRAQPIGCMLVGAGQGPVSTSAELQAQTWSARIVGAGTTTTLVEIEQPLSTSAAARPTKPRERHRVQLPLLGAFNVMNALQALVTIASAYPHAPISRLLEALERVQPPPGRLEPVSRDGAPINVFVDYAHTDDALDTVLTTIRSAMLRQRGELHANPDARPSFGHDNAIPAGRLWCVFGCGGDRDRTKRPRMGRVASERADRIVITSDNPRTEDASAIIAEVQSGVTGPLVSRGEPRVVVEPDRERAIRFAIRSAAPGDVVCIAGKGHEDYQILPDPLRPGQTITRHFDDREIARSALSARGIEPRPVPSAKFTPIEASLDTLGDELLDIAVTPGDEPETRA
jgi:UDP-N-acetylmuramoyl-L-alanyl-D-glutamate--2,6-diaminopimelate ligase